MRFGFFKFEKFLFKIVLLKSIAPDADRLLRKINNENVLRKNIRSSQPIPKDIPFKSLGMPNRRPPNVL